MSCGTGEIRMFVRFCGKADEFIMFVVVGMLLKHMDGEGKRRAASARGWALTSKAAGRHHM